MSKKPSLSDIILNHFKKFPNKELKHDDWIDIVSAQYKELNGKNPRDPWRAARKLHQDGFLVKVGKGIYKYDPDYVHEPELEDFNTIQRKQILERDNYRCVICGRGEAEGMELQVDHIKPKNLGGKATLKNGQTLCAQHNFLKKTNSQTETGKRMFITLLNAAIENDEDEIVDFCRDILAIYEKHNMNGHIIWQDDSIPSD